MDKIGKQLKIYRLKHDLSLDEVAFMLDIPVSEYAAMENNTAGLSLKQLLKLCKYYNIKPDGFLNPDAIENKKADLTEPFVSPETTTVQEAIIEEENDDDEFDTDYPSKFDLDRSKRTVKAKQVIEALKKEGKEVTEEQAEKVLDFMYLMAPIALNHATRELKWQHRLESNPKGFPVKSGRFPCRLCGHGGGDQPMWHDRFGLKCWACQHAVDTGIIPGEITSDDSLYYSEFDMGRNFNLKGKALREWIKTGLLKPRTIPGANGKGKYYQVFLISDHKGFFPPKEMLRTGWIEETTKEGKEELACYPWYFYPHIIKKLQKYGIAKYLRFTQEPDTKNTETAEPEETP